MTSALLHCLNHIGRGNPKNWQTEAQYQGNFSLPNEFAPYHHCQYSNKGLTLYKEGFKGSQTFTASMCDAVASKIKQQQLTLGL